MCANDQRQELYCTPGCTTLWLLTMAESMTIRERFRSHHVGTVGRDCVSWLQPDNRVTQLSMFELWTLQPSLPCPSRAHTHLSMLQHLWHHKWVTMTDTLQQKEAIPEFNQSPFLTMQQSQLAISLVLLSIHGWISSTKAKQLLFGATWSRHLQNSPMIRKWKRWNSRRMLTTQLTTTSSSWSSYTESILSSTQYKYPLGRVRGAVKLYIIYYTSYT